jgi:site-specific recombinase XerC
MMNHGTSLREVVTVLSREQVKEAESAFNRLAELERTGDTSRRHSLGAAVEFYLKHQDAGKTKPVEFDYARRQFLISKERDGVRARSLLQLDSTLRQFQGIVGKDAHVCDITTADVESYLNGLRSKDGKHKAAVKTFNGYRADLNVFCVWCVEQTDTNDQGQKLRWMLENPVEWKIGPDNNWRGIKKKIAVERDVPETLNVSQVRALLRHVESFKDGCMVPYFALALFAGLRTGTDGELQKLALHPEKLRLIDLERGVIHIKPDISKTGQYRQVIIRPALAAWLTRYGLDILPTGYDRHLKAIRKEMQLGHDVLRHTFFSMHVAKHKSVGEAALEGGNTEAVLKKHYLNLATYTEGDEFWGIVPDSPAPKIIPIGTSKKTNTQRRTA